MSLSHRVRLWVLPCLLTCAALASAQVTASSTSPAPESGTAPPPAAHVSSVDGSATLERDGASEPLTAGLPLLSGDRLRTTSGRVEIQFADGSALHLDESTTADLLATDLIRILDGRLYLLAAGSRDPSRAVRYQVDAPAASVQTNWPGQYRLAVSDDGVELAVVTGEATLATDAGAVTVRAGERAFAQDGRAPSPPEYFNSARWDTFDRWSAARRDTWAGPTSGQYLPTELGAYAGTFDRYGSWRDEPSVGHVWYPSVQEDWRPYSQGYWREYPSWGSVWIGQDPWGWATHHYGRWGFSTSWGWYWIPSRTWGPGWVSWTTAPGYVSWCALGYHEGPVFGLWGLRGSVYGSRLDPWRGWTVIPRHAFGRRLLASHVAIDGRRLDGRVRTSFVAHRRAPTPDHAVPRSLASASPSARGNGGRGAAGVGASAGMAVPRYGRGDGTGLSRAVGADWRDGLTGGGAGVSASPRGSSGRRSFPVESGTNSDGTYQPRAFGSPDTAGVPRSSPRTYEPRTYEPRTYEPRSDDAPRSYESPRSSESPRTDDPSRATPRSYEAPGGSGASGIPRSTPRTYDAPRSYESPRSSESPRTYDPSRATPRSYEAPGGSGASGMPRSTPRTYEPRTYDAPRSYESPRSSESPRTYDPSRATPRSDEAPGGSGASGMPRSTPRTYEPRTYDAPRSYESPRSSDAPRSSEPSRSAPRSSDSPRVSSPRGGESRPNSSGSRYNPGTAGSRNGGQSSSSSRRRSRDQ